MSAACVAASSLAGEKEMAASANLGVNADAVNVAIQPVQLQKAAHKCASLQQFKMKKAAKAPAAGEFAFFRPAENVMAIGFSTNGYSYTDVTFGFASSNVPLYFNNISSGASSSEWTYTKINDYVGKGQNAEWIYSTSNETDLVIPTVQVGEILNPELEVTFPSGDKASYTNEKVVEYLIGGAGSYWMGEDPLGGEYGVSFYQNFGQQNSAGNAFGYTYMTSYDITDSKNYDSNGVYKDWQEMFNNSYGNVTDIQLHSFMFYQPKPASMYLMTKGWGLLQVDASAATQLLSYIYPIAEDGAIEEMPIAIGYASVSKGNNPLVMFEYYPLNEDGDEEEGEVFIDSAVIISVEGFNGNDAVSSMSPASGFYPFSYNADQNSDIDLDAAPTLYMEYSFAVDGEYNSGVFYDPGLYYYDQKGDPDAVTSICFQTFTTDATFPYIYATDGVQSVSVPEAGGKVEIELNALYYNIPALLEDGIYELSAPEWISVEFGESSQQTGITPTTLTVAASEEGRTGVVSIEGLGASFSLEVVQGEGGAVNAIVVDKNSEYFDLAGRRVANPEKGIYIKKTGNKAEKVLF